VGLKNALDNGISCDRIAAKVRRKMKNINLPMRNTRQNPLSNPHFPQPAQESNKTMTETSEQEEKMTQINEQVITTILLNDPTVRKEWIERAVSILNGEDEKREPVEGLSRRVLSREETAEMLNVSKQTVSRWGKEGKIAMCKNGKKAYGYSYESVISFISESTKEFSDEKKAA